MDCRVKPGNDERKSASELIVTLVVTTGLDPVVYAAGTRLMPVSSVVPETLHGLPGQARQ
ncbi:MAG: hypothetical protein WAU57_07840 [Xanthobacteraceae bacterium]